MVQSGPEKIDGIQDEPKEADMIQNEPGSVGMIQDEMSNRMEQDGMPEVVKQDEVTAPNSVEQDEIAAPNSVEQNEMPEMVKQDEISTVSHQIEMATISHQDEISAILNQVEISNISQQDKRAAHPQKDETTAPSINPQGEIAVPKINSQQDASDKTGIKIDWSRPVFLKTLSSCIRVSRPSLQLFKLDHVEITIAKGHLEEARIMLRVVGAEKQCKRRDARFLSKFWELYKVLHPQEKPSNLKKMASKFIDEKVLETIFPASAEQDDMVTDTPQKSFMSTMSNMSPMTPEITMPDSVFKAPRTPDDEETMRMQEEIDQVVRRTPILQKVTPPRRPVIIQKALTAIKETSIYKGAMSKTVKADPESTKSSGGSAYLYAMITPNKKMREMLETNAAVSPVRRSKRLLSADSPSKGGLYSHLDEIPNLAECGFIPNAAIADDTPSRKRVIKADPAVDDVPSKKRAVEDTLSKEHKVNQDPQENPFQ